MDARQYQVRVFRDSAFGAAMVFLHLEKERALELIADALPSKCEISEMGSIPIGR